MVIKFANATDSKAQVVHKRSLHVQKYSLYILFIKENEQGNEPT